MTCFSRDSKPRCTRLGPLKDALPTELQRRSKITGTYHASAGLWVARVGPSVALALLDTTDQADDGHAGDRVLLVPTVEPLARILARFGLELRRTVAKLDAGGRSHGH